MACQGCDNPGCDGRFCRGRYKPEFLAAITDDHIDLVAALTEHLAAAASDEDLAALVAAVASADDDRADDGGTAAVAANQPDGGAAALDDGGAIAVAANHPDGGAGRSGGSDTTEPPPEIGTGRRRLGKGRGRGAFEPLTQHRSSVVLPKPCPICPNMPAGAPWVITEEIKNLMRLGTSPTTARDGASKAAIAAGPTTARDGASKAGVAAASAASPTATGHVVSTEVAVPWESSPSTWMLPSQNGVLDAFLDSLPATGTVAVDRMPESSAETAADIDEGSSSTQLWLDQVDDTATRMRRRRAAFLRAELQAAAEEATKAAAAATQAVDALTAAVIALNALVIAASASS